MHRGLMM